MSDPHAGHHAHDAHRRHGSHDDHGAAAEPTRDATAVEPGYPEHPELPGRGAATEHASHAHGGHAATAQGAHAGHDKHAGHSVAMFRDKFWLSLLLTVPTLVWGHMLQRALGYTAPQVPGAMYIPAAFGTAVFIYGGWPFLRGAVRELADRLPGMMTL